MTGRKRRGALTPALGRALVELAEPVKRAYAKEIEADKVLAQIDVVR